MSTGGRNEAGNGPGSGLRARLHLSATHSHIESAGVGGWNAQPIRPRRKKMCPMVARWLFWLSQRNIDFTAEFPTAPNPGQDVVPVHARKNCDVSFKH